MPDPEEYLWQPGEREQVEAELSERRSETQREETLAWCRQRAELRDNNAENAPKSRTNVVRREVPYDGAGQPLPVVTKQYGAPAEPDWDAWRKFILATVRGKFVTDKLLADVLKEVAKADNEALAPLHAEIAALRAEVAELRVAAMRRTEPATADDARKRAGDIRRIAQDAAKLRVAG